MFIVVFTRGALTECHRLGDLGSHGELFLQNSGGWKSKTKMLVELMPPDHLLGL